MCSSLQNNSAIYAKKFSLRRKITAIVLKESSASENFDQKRIATHRELSDELRQIERVVAERRRHISCVVGSFCGLRTIIGTIK